MTGAIFLPALQGRFGDWLYYSAIISLDELKARVSYAREIYENEKLSDHIQRRLDDKKRKNEIAEFLLQNPDRFFNSLVVGVHGGDPQWHPFDVEVRDKAHKLDDIDQRDREAVGYLALNGTEKLFALDGQHRLSGVREALSRDSEIGADRVSVIFVSHRDTDKGRRRTRNLFVMLNKSAVPVKKPDIIALDEVDLAAIITRRLVDQHRWFSAGQIDFKRHTNNLPKSDRQHLTTLGNLYDIVGIAIRKIMAPENSEELKAARRLRLPEGRINYYQDLLIECLDRISRLDPLLSDYFETSKFEVVLNRARDPAEPHVLFRPIGLLIFAKTLGELRKSFSLEESFERIAQAPLVMTAAPYNQIIWDPAKGNINMKGSSLSQKLLVYMLGGRSDHEKLRTAYAEWCGDLREKVRLPNRIVA